jgi:hypothetical protein
MNPQLITPYLIAAIVLWALYRRMRRSFGRQRVRDGLMWLRVLVLSAAAVFIGIEIARDSEVLGTLLAGIAAGAALGYVAIRFTKFEVTPEGRFYTPHTYIGLAVTALFVGRVLYRFLGAYNGALPAPGADQNLAAVYEHSPFTVAVIGVLVGYYVVYNVGVMLRTRAAVGTLAA